MAQPISSPIAWPPARCASGGWRGAPASSDAARVHHHADWRAEGLGRDVLVPLGTHDARVTVGATDLAPDDTELGVLHLLLGLVHVSNPLAEVPPRVLLRADPIDLDQRARGVAVGLASLVAEDAA